MPRLTKTIIDRFEPAATDFFAWDSELPGFGVRVWPTGRKVYMVQYRAAGRTRRLKLGTHGAIATDQARTQAKIVLGDVARGEDPALDKATRRKSLTVAELCDRYMAAAERGLVMGKGRTPKKASTLLTDRSRITAHIKPLLGSKLVIDVTRSDVVRFVRDVTTGSTATNRKTARLRGRSIVAGGSGAASRTAGLLGALFTYAVDEGIRESNPVRGVARPADRHRDRRLTADEYKRLGAALADGEDADAWQMTLGIRLLALMGCRLGEIAGLRWGEVDKAGGCFRLADTKTGASVRAIGRAAFATLDEPGKPDDPVLSGARRKGAYGGLPGALERVLKRAGIEGVTAHTLRHSFASVAGDLGYSDSTIAAMLGHAAGSITGRYVHRLDSVLVAAANKIASEVWRQMTGESAKVVALRA